MVTSKEIEIFKEDRTQIKALRATFPKSPIPWRNWYMQYISSLFIYK